MFIFSYNINQIIIKIINHLLITLIINKINNVIRFYLVFLLNFILGLFHFRGFLLLILYNINFMNIDYIMYLLLILGIDLIFINFWLK